MSKCKWLWKGLLWTQANKNIIDSNIKREGLYAECSVMYHVFIEQLHVNVYLYFTALHKLRPRIEVIDSISHEIQIFVMIWKDIFISCSR